MFYAVEFLFHGGFGGACYLGDFSEAFAVEVEEEQFPFVVVIEAVDEVVEAVVA